MAAFTTLFLKFGVSSYPVMFLKAFALPAAAAALTIVAETAPGGLEMAIFLNGRNLNVFPLFCPTTITEFLLKF